MIRSNDGDYFGAREQPFMTGSIGSVSAIWALRKLVGSINTGANHGINSFTAGRCGSAVATEITAVK
jgi:hypothetical protein